MFCVWWRCAVGIGRTCRFGCVWCRCVVGLGGKRVALGVSGVFMPWGLGDGVFGLLYRVMSCHVVSH